MSATATSPRPISDAVRQVLASPGHPLRSTKEVKEAFSKAGISVSEFSRQFGFSTGLVHQVISGRKIGKYGQAHVVAVLLGMKHGFLPAEITR